MYNPIQELTKLHLYHKFGDSSSIPSKFIMRTSHRLRSEVRKDTGEDSTHGPYWTKGNKSFVERWTILGRKHCLKQYQHEMKYNLWSEMTLKM